MNYADRYFQITNKHMSKQDINRCWALENEVLTLLFEVADLQFKLNGGSDEAA